MGLPAGSFFHGTTTRGIKQLDVGKGLEGWPFGPGIYLSRDERVANCYTKGDGAIYEVALTGDDAMCLNFDLSWRDQTPEVRTALTSVFTFAGVPLTFDHGDNVRPLVERLQSAIISKRVINEWLAKNGIWMVCGHVSAYEHSGRMDDGIQYVVLANRSAMIVKTMEIGLATAERITQSQKPKSSGPGF